MASPSPPASPTSSVASGESTNVRDRTEQVEDLVGHFVAAKRSLSTQTVLWRATEIVTSAREHLEENAILSAKNAAIGSIIEEQVDALEAIRRGIDIVAADVQSEFKNMLHDLDASFSGLQATLVGLRDTPIDAALQPPDAAQKQLFDFIDNTAVTALGKSLRDSIDRYNEARAVLDDSNDSLDTALDNLDSSLKNVPKTPLSASNPSPIPGLYHDLEGHAQEAAQAFQSLVSHYDLCATALRHTEGGAAAATQAAGDATLPSTSEPTAALEFISADERREMLAVLVKDASEVEDVVSEIRDRGTEMSYLLSQVDTHITQLRSEDSALHSIITMIERIVAQVKVHIASSRSFHAHWLEDTKPALLTGIEEWESQREFYERFDLAYAELLVEISSRRRRHDKAKRKADEAQRELDRLYTEDDRAREQFALMHGDFLPLDIWPQLRDRPRRYEVKAVPMTEEEEAEGEDAVAKDEAAIAKSIPLLDRDVVERALTKVKTRM